MLTNLQLDTLLANIAYYIEHGTADKGQKQLFDAIGAETLEDLYSYRSETRVVNLLDGICDFYNKYSNDELSYEDARECLKDILRQADEFKQTKVVQVIEEKKLGETYNYKQRGLQPQSDFMMNQPFAEGDVFLSTGHPLEKCHDLNKKTLPFAHLAADRIDEELPVRPRTSSFSKFTRDDNEVIDMAKFDFMPKNQRSRADSFIAQEEERRSRGGSEDKSFGK